MYAHVYTQIQTYVHARTQVYMNIFGRNALSLDLDRESKIRSQFKIPDVEITSSKSLVDGYLQL